MKIVYFGIYSKGAAYPRNRNIINALQNRGHDVAEVHYEMAGSFQARADAASGLTGAVKFFISTAWSYLLLGYKYLRVGRHDVVVVGHPGYFHIHLAKVLTYFRRDRPLLVYDIFFPLYDAVVEDRGIIGRGSIKARLLHSLEASCCKQAEINLVDTNEHGSYICSEFGLDRESIVRVFVGSTLQQKEAARGITPESGKFKIVFVGTYIPLHGIETILKAAERLLPLLDVEFTLVGSGQLKEKMKAYARSHHLSNVKFLDWVDTKELPGFMEEFDLALGVFGSTEKAMRVIATKVFDICAVGLPFISSDSAAMREAFEHGVNCYLVPRDDFVSLAEAIKILREDSELREKLARGAREIYRTELCPNTICDNLLMKIDSTRA